MGFDYCCYRTDRAAGYQLNGKVIISLLFSGIVGARQYIVRKFRVSACLLKIAVLNIISEPQSDGQTSVRTPTVRHEISGMSFIQSRLIPLISK